MKFNQRPSDQQYLIIMAIVIPIWLGIIVLLMFLSR